MSEEEVVRRVQEGVAEAQAEADEGVSDLLVCLGQEERKVEVLSGKLQQMGIDVDALLDSLPADAEGRPQEIEVEDLS